MFLIIAGLWVWVFVPSWFKRSEEKQAERATGRRVRGEIKAVKKESSRAPISAIAEQNFRLSMTRRVSSTVAFFAFGLASASIFLAVSQFFYWIVTFVFSAIFFASLSVARAAKRRSREVLTRSSKTRSAMYAASSLNSSLSYESAEKAGMPVDTRSWEAQQLPAPRQRIGELQTLTLAEVVDLDARSVNKPAATLDSNALDEILRRRRANG